VKALRLHAAGELRLHEEPDPDPRPGELLLRVTGVGLCGSDRHWFVEGGIGDAALVRPLVLGHEFAGVIASGPDEGTRVVLDPAVPCGRCAPCTSGNPHVCLSQRFAGHGSTDGALRTLVAWPEKLAHPLPDSVPDVEATLLEPLGVALHALGLGGVGRGTRAAVFGCGPLGLLLVQALRAAGATVELATDVLEHRLAAAEALGAARVLPAGEPSEGLALDVGFEAAGDDVALADAITHVRPRGLVVLVGIPDRDRTSFSASAARRKEVSLFLCRRMLPGDLPRALELVEAGEVALSPLVSSRYPLEAFAQAFADLVGRRGLKVVIEP
jgi:L-iditol 2-dehydrogenase